MSLEDKISQLITAIEKLNSNINRISAIRVNELGGDELVPLAKWGQVHDWPGQSSMKNIVYSKELEGTEAFIKRIGRRVYIDEKAFFEWAKSGAC